MRAFSVIVLSLLATTPLWAQQTCSTAAEQRDAAIVAHLRAALRSIKLNTDDPEAEVPPLAQEDLPALKSALAQTARDVLACHDTTITPSTLQEHLGKLLDANPPQPPAGVAVMNGDKRYREWLAFGYGRNLLVNVRKLVPGLLGITFTFHIPCGDDNMLMIFEVDHGQWRDRLVWQSPPYKEINGAFGDIYENAILQSGPKSSWRLVVIHGKPWCASRFSGFAIDVLAPTSDSANPHVVWHTDRSYSRGEFTPRLKASGDIFEFRIHEDEMSFDPDNAFERTVIYRYRVSETGITRLEPVATTGRGFVEEWLSMPWQEARDQTDSANPAALQIIHQQYEDSYPANSNFFTSWTAGPVRACAPTDRVQVAFDSQRNDTGSSKPSAKQSAMVPHYFQIQRAGNGYKMLAISGTPYPACSGHILLLK